MKPVVKRGNVIFLFQEPSIGEEEIYMGLEAAYDLSCEVSPEDVRPSLEESEFRLYEAEQRERKAANELKKARADVKIWSEERNFYDAVYKLSLKRTV